jgi:hypothetical protein
LEIKERIKSGECEKEIYEWIRKNIKGKVNVVK